MLVCAAACLAGCATGEPTGDRAFSFALVADVPYSAAEARAFDALIDRVNADPAVRFVLHAGDIKGGDPCSDALLRTRIAQLQRFDKPVVYTPGDNEWADCHHSQAGRFDPLERLAFLRRLAYAQPGRSLGGRPMSVATQADDPQHAAFVENTRFSVNGVVFAAVHVAGSNNALHPWHGAPRPLASQLAAFRARESAALAWLDEAFASAKAQRAAAVVVLMHANPRFDLGPGSRARAGFERVIERLRALVVDFGGAVLLAHGDHHFYIIDRPLTSDRDPSRDAARLTRVQTVGSPFVGWLRITVDPDAEEPFLFALRL